MLFITGILLVISCRSIVVNGFTLAAMEPHKLRINLGRVIRARRVFQGFSQEAFAGKIGVHRTYQGAVERGEQNVTVETLIRIADGLNTKVSELFAEAEKALKPQTGRK